MCICEPRGKLIFVFVCNLKYTYYYIHVDVIVGHFLQRPHVMCDRIQYSLVGAPLFIEFNLCSRYKVAYTY